MSRAAKPSSRRKIWIGSLIVLLLGLFSIYVYINRPKPAHNDYREVDVTRGTIEITVFATGEVKPENRLEIRPAIAGRADQVLIAEGDFVHEGQPLVWMSSTERAALMDAARARGPEETKKWEDLYRSAPILAPITGTIIAKNIESGQTFGVTDPILVMSDRLTVHAQVDETDIGEIRVGQSATIVLDAYPNDKIPGRVDRIAFEAKTVNNVTTYIATVVSKQIPKFMRSGMTANVTFHVSTKPSVLNIPVEAVKIRGQEKFVQLATADPKMPLERHIETGISDGKHVEITNGLTEGDRILVPKISMLLHSKSPTLSPMNPLAGGASKAKLTEHQ